MNAMARLGGRRAVSRSGSSGGYPWSDGDFLYAGDLNAAFLPVTGATPMTGPLTLSGNATLPLHAVPLQQLTAATTGVFLPLATGGTVTGATTFSGAGTGLTVTNNATVGGTATVTGTATISGATLTLGGATSATSEQIFLRSQAPQARYVSSFTAGTRRWDWGTDNTGEVSPTNAGSNFVINAYNDAGTYVGAVLQAVRGSGPGGTGAPYILNLRPFQMSQSRATTPGGVIGNDISFPSTGADVQPVTTLGASPLSVTSGSAVVNITWTGCGASGGVFAAGLGECYVNLLGVTAVGGITPTGWLKGARVDNNTFSITWTSNATSTTTGGGSAVTVQPNFPAIAEKSYAVMTGGTQGYPIQYERLFVANPPYFKAQGAAGPGPQFQQEFRQVYSPNDPSGTNAWGIIGTEMDLLNRGPDTGYSPNLFSVVNPSIGFWTGCFGTASIPPTIAPGGGTVQHWNTVFSVFQFGTKDNYVAYSVQPNALVGQAIDSVTNHGGVAFMAFGSYSTIQALAVATTSGSAVLTITASGADLARQVNGNSVYIPTVQTVLGVTFGGASYVMSNVTASTFQITGTGNATSTGTGGLFQWLAFATRVPYAPMDLQGSWKHGISTTNFRSEDGSIINTQPANGIIWNDGTGSASIRGAAGTAGNVGVTITTAGTGTFNYSVLPPNAANDAAAASAGVQVGGTYRNGSVLQVRTV